MRTCYLRLNNASHAAIASTMCHAGTNSARPSIAPLSEPQWGLTLIEPLRPYYLGSGRRSRNDGRKLLILSTSRTLAARRGEQSTNLLAGLDTPFTSAPLSGFLCLATCEERGTQDGCRESTKLVNMQLSDLWKIPTPEGNSTSELIRPKELAATVGCQKPGKSPGLDSIFLEFILHAGSALKSWFCDFLTSWMRQLKIPRMLRRALIFAIPKPEKPFGTQRVIALYSYCVSPSRSSTESSKLVSNRSTTRCSTEAGG